MALDRGSNTHLTAEGGLGEAYSRQLPVASLHQQEKKTQKKVTFSHPMPFPASSSETDDPCVDGPSSSYEACRGRTPSPPPPPSNVGYIPTFLPRNDPLASSEAIPSEKLPSGLAMGALAAGALIFGDDFMSGFDVPPVLGDDTHAIPTDPPVRTSNNLNSFSQY